jgi:hypothetical protein
VSAINFPSNPGIGTIFVNVRSGFSYQWDGTVWNSYSPASVSNVEYIDDIAVSFNGLTQTFPLAVNGVPVRPASPQALLVSIGGVVQEPYVDYNVSDSNISFTTPPLAGLFFFAVSYGSAFPVTQFALANGVATEGDFNVSGRLNVSGITSTTSLQVGSGVTVNGSSGIVSATGFHGDATRLYNVLGVQNSGTLIGVAKTINFSSNLNATFDSGITTVTASVAGINTLGTSNFNQLVISGLSTFRGSNNTNVHLGNTSYYAGLTWSGVSGIYTGTEPSILTDSSLGLEISGGLGDLTLSAPSGTGDVILKASNTTAIIVDNSDSAQVELYQGGTKKFETIGAGVTVFGTTFSNDLNASGIVTATGGFVSSANTSPVQIQVVGNQLTFNVVGIGSTTLTLF